MQISAARYGYPNRISLANDNGANRIGSGSNGTTAIANSSWNPQIVREVNDIVRESLRLDDDVELKPDTVIWLDGPDSLGADSLDVVELIIDLQNGFDIVIADSETTGIRSLAEVYTLIQRKTQNT